MTTSTMVLDRAAERRTKYIQGLRELIALLESNPDLPAPYLFPEATVHTSCETDDEGVAAVARIADRLGVKVATSAGGTHIKAILTLPSGAAYEFLHISHGEMARYSEHMRKYHEDKATSAADDALVQTAPLDVETAADMDGVAAALLGQDEPDESEYAVATWSCRCGEGGFELAAREYAQREAREHLDGVGARVFTAKPPFVAQTVHALGVNGSHDDPYPCGAEGGAGSFLIRDVTCTGCLAADSPAEAGVAPESGTAVA